MNYKKLSRGNLRKALIVMSIFFFLEMNGCVTSHDIHVKDEETPVVYDWSDITKEWGIEIVGIRLSASGYMLDFRYKIVDAEKATYLVLPEIKPYLIDHKTGAKLSVPDLPKIGALRKRSRRAIPGVIYFILFSNPNRFIKSGDKVTVVIGDLKIEGLTVE